MCFVPGSGWKHLDLEQYRISGLTLHTSVEGVSEFQVIHAFKQGVKYRELSLKLAISPHVTSLGRLMEIANKYANSEERSARRP